MTGQFTWVEPKLEHERLQLPHQTVQATQTRPAQHGQAPSVLPAWDVAPQVQPWSRHVAVAGAPTRPVTAAPSSSTRRDGIIGITVGLALLAATLTGSFAMSYLGPKSLSPAPVASTPIAMPAAPAAAATPLAPAADPLASQPGAVSPDPSAASPGSAQVKTPAAQRQVAAPAGQTPARATTPATPASPAAAGGGSATHSGHAGTSASTPTPAAARPKPTPVVAAPADPAPATPVPEAKPIVSYTVSTPGGKEWTVKPEDYAKNAAVANATLTPNYG